MKMQRCAGLRRHLSALLAMLLATFALQSWAEFPERAIRLVVPWPAGATTDVAARIFGDRLSKKLGVGVVVENRGGANAIVGTQFVAKSAPDGYTLEFTTSEPLTINPNIYKTLPYDVEKDLEPLAFVGRTYFVVAAKAAFPANDIQGAIALAKQQPGKITVGSYGIADMFLGSFESATGTQFLMVPFQGGGPAITAVLGGQVDLTLAASFSAAQHVAGGRIKVLGVGSAKRLQLLPDTPTFIEQGMAGFEIGNWVSIHAPRGLPERTREVLRQAIEEIVRSAEFVERGRAIGIEVDYAPPDALRAFMRADSARWRKVAREKKIEIE